jgi:hypothetical protein
MVAVLRLMFFEVAVGCLGDPWRGGYLQVNEMMREVLCNRRRKKRKNRAGYWTQPHLFKCARGKGSVSSWSLLES